MPGSVLLVDDDSRHLGTLIDVLESSDEGFELLIAQNGKDALEIAREESPGLVVLDWELPGINGVDVLRKLRSHQSTRSTPVIMFTVRTSVADLKTAFQAGATDYIRKPVNRDELLARVKAAIMMNKTRVLFLGANPSDLTHLRLGEEIREISLGLKLGRERSRFTLVQEWAVRTDTLQQALLDESPQIVHFSGHGFSSAASVGRDSRLLGRPLTDAEIVREGIALEDYQGNVKIVSGEALANLFGLFANTIRCVILNACYSDHQAAAIGAKIGYVIGMTNTISDAASIAFSLGFYKALASGLEISKAFELGRASVMLEGLHRDATPVLWEGGTRLESPDDLERGTNGE